MSKINETLIKSYEAKAELLAAEVVNASETYDKNESAIMRATAFCAISLSKVDELVSEDYPVHRDVLDKSGLAWAAWHERVSCFVARRVDLAAAVTLAEQKVARHAKSRPPVYPDDTAAAEAKAVVDADVAKREARERVMTELRGAARPPSDSFLGGAA